MKKIVVWIAIVSMLLGLTACGQQATQSAYPGTMTELVEGIYRNCTQQPEFALGDPTPIDTSDAFALQSYLGLTDASLVTRGSIQRAHDQRPGLFSVRPAGS